MEIPAIPFHLSVFHRSIMRKHCLSRDDDAYRRLIRGYFAINKNYDVLEISIQSKIIALREYCLEVYSTPSGMFLLSCTVPDSTEMQQDCEWLTTTTACRTITLSDRIRMPSSGELSSPAAISSPLISLSLDISRGKRVGDTTSLLNRLP